MARRSQRLRDESTIFLVAMFTVGVGFIVLGVLGIVWGGSSDMSWFPIGQLVIGILLIVMMGVALMNKRRERRNAPAVET